jgi:uncharacterized membrane protein
MTHPRSGHNRALLWPALRARPRLLASVLSGAVAYGLVTAIFSLSRAASVLVAWNVGALLNLALTAHMVWKTDVEAIKRRAITQDQGRTAILAVVLLGTAAVLLAVGSQLALAHDMHGTERIAHVSLALLTVLTSWFFTQTLFALHYAHDFYLARLHESPDPLLFPGTPDPLYPDFLHFAIVIGTAAQTADIAFNGPTLRPVGTLHCIVSFFFNASLLALSINVVAGVVT